MQVFVVWDLQPALQSVLQQVLNSPYQARLQDSSYFKSIQAFSIWMIKIVCVLPTRNAD